MPAFVHRVTKYDPANRDERGRYLGDDDTDSDRGPIEAAYLQAVSAFAAECGIDRLSVREPEASFFAAAEDGGSLEALFPGLRGFHDGAEVSLEVALELVRMMLRGGEGWCRLEAAGDEFFVHIGWDQYLYLGTDRPCGRAIAHTRQLGLFPELIADSPYAEEPDEPGPQRPADEEFWARVRRLVAEGQAGVLEEGYVQNASHWHRLTSDTIDTVRAGLAPRAMLTLWPPLSTDVAAVLASLPEDDRMEFVWEDPAGTISSVHADAEQREELAVLVTGARAAAALPTTVDEHRPLASAVLPDADGVLRARWRTTWSPCDRTWAFLSALRPGQVVTGTVTGVADTVTFVDVDGFTARIRQPELSWRPLRHPSDLVPVGQEVTAEVLGTDLVREELYLSLKALQDNPLKQLADRVGELVDGVVTKVLPFGVFVRVEDRPDGLQGLVPTAELAGEAVQVGDPLAVRILEVDLARQRFLLSRRRALT
ncbi:S1 RNA-binding domain-containing protein [Kitasatospora sp. NPDC059673]|uniref:S1 RNA-binding domain-containing protein n=1 Tax=Kitasatospora sp. NPDC059673 TaxID=3346901 RepID=UPI00367F3E19